VAQCVFVRSKEKDPTTTIDTDFTIPVSAACGLGDGQRSFFILPVNTIQGTDTVTNFSKVTLTIDTTPPTAPSSVKGGAGQTEIKVSWTQPSDTYYFWVIVDTNVSIGTDLDSGINSDCLSTSLTAGANFDPESANLPDGIWVKHINEKASSATLSSDDFGITEGKAAVAVMAEDLGRNRSLVSNVACLDIVPTVGFWDKYKQGGGLAEQGCACTALGTDQHHAPRALGALGLVGLVWVARRRVRRRS
jgi:hypothetical protein